MTDSPRIISLLPSATEIVAALGFGDHLVGRSHECDFPAGVETLPACSSTKVPAEGTSSEIDERVKEIVAEGLSVYRVDTERLRELEPDLILTQTQCAVCAVTPRDLEQALCTWTGAQPVMVSLEPNSLDDVWDDFRRVGEALGVSSRAEEVIASLTKRLDNIRAATGKLSRPTVAAIEWLDPLMAGGNWMPELIEIAGGQSLLARPGEHSSWLDWSSLIEADPEIILLLPCGFKIEQTIRDLNLLTENPAWDNLRAVRNGRVYVIDGHHFFNRPGPRLVESAEIVAEILHPELFQFGHRGTGWISLGEVARL
ncbi:MAG: iron complex transport system substrate-binding protein [Verrucomicrobiota bacterium]|jgi:iron complex transport system substrate-binding protein